MKIDLENLKLMKEIFTPHPVQVASVPARDTFQVFSSGLRENWIFVATVVAVGMFIINNITEQKNVNAFQDVKIQATIEDIAQANANIDQNAKNIQTLNNTQVANYNDLIRRMDVMQAALDTLKGN